MTTSTVKVIRVLAPVCILIVASIWFLYSSRLASLPRSAPLSLPNTPPGLATPPPRTVRLSSSAADLVAQLPLSAKERWRVDNGAPITASEAERVTLEIMQADERRRARFITHPKSQHGQDFTIILEEATPAERAALMNTSESILNISNQAQNEAWVAKLRAQLLDHLVYGQNYRVLQLHLPDQPDAPLEISQQNCDDVSPNEELNSLSTTGFREFAFLNVEDASKRFAHLFSISTE